MKEEDFQVGQHGFRDNVFIKPILLKSLSCQEALHETEDAIRSTMRREPAPYIIFCINSSPAATFSISELYDAARSFHHFDILGTILDSAVEKRIYLCLRNDRRGSLDLHQMSALEAQEAVSSVLLEAFRNFELECHVITGKGNHSHNQRGVLKQRFRSWMRSADLAFIVHSFRLRNEGGSYQVQRTPPERLLITCSEDVVRSVERINKEYRCQKMPHCRFIIDFSDLRLSEMFKVNLLHHLLMDCHFIEGKTFRSREEHCYHYPDSIPKTL